MTLVLKFLLCLNGKCFDFKRTCKVNVFLRDWVEMFVSQGNYITQTIIQCQLQYCFLQIIYTALQYPQEQNLASTHYQQG